MTAEELRQLIAQKMQQRDAVVAESNRRMAELQSWITDIRAARQGQVDALNDHLASLQQQLGLLVDAEAAEAEARAKSPKDT